MDVEGFEGGVREHAHVLTKGHALFRFRLKLLLLLPPKQQFLEPLNTRSHARTHARTHARATQVLDAAQDSIKAGRVAHAVFEYTPKQFEHLPTDWVDFLPRLYRLGAKECYICHRLKGKIFRVSEAMLQQVHDALYKIRMQTDIFCTFNVRASVADKSFFKDAKDWTPQTSLLS